MIAGYNNYQRGMFYAFDHGSPLIASTKEFRLISDIRISRTKTKQMEIKPFVEQEYPSLYFVDKFNEVLSNEFSGQYDHNHYKQYKRNLEKSTKREKDLYKSIDLIDKFYTLNKIYDPKTKKPAWTQLKKPLTSAKSYANLQSKPQPTVGKLVTEFMPDI
jgi:hypothetical protein